MKRITTLEQDWLKDYLIKEEIYNVYMLSDLENYGLESENVEFLISEDENLCPVILMRFYNSFVIYSYVDNFFLKEVLEEIKKRKSILNDISCITGKIGCIEHMVIDKEKIRITHILENKVSVQKMERQSNLLTRNYSIEDVDKILAHYRDIPEMQEKYGSNNNGAREDIINNLGSGRLIGIEKDGKIVSSIMTTAETKNRAMLINVCTNPGYRGQGFCTELLLEICKELFVEGKQSIYIYYENVEVEKIYINAGFEFVGDYGRISVNDIL